MNRDNIKEIMERFAVGAEPQAYGDGHINDTYLSEGRSGRYILQRINKNVFHHPDEVMENIVAVTEHLRKKIIAAGGNPERETLTVISASDGKPYTISESGEYYRMYKYIADARSYQTVEKPEHFRSAARAFGRFQKLLADFPAEKLYETIPQFHDTGKRYNDFISSVERDPVGRCKDIQPEIDFIIKRKEETTVITNLIKNGELPLRVTHNDTKYNNVLIDDTTGEAICVIDLDTVMPGSLLYDFGDSIRVGANPAAEDEKDLSLVRCDNELFRCYAEGYLGELGSSITSKERELLVFGSRVMIFESVIRFLADYIDGDVYFKTDYPEHNLVRTRNQIRLQEDMEEKDTELRAIIDSID